jgi:hypothetical protein
MPPMKMVNPPVNKNAGYHLMHSVVPSGVTMAAVQTNKVHMKIPNKTVRTPSTMRVMDHPRAMRPVQPNVAYKRVGRHEDWVWKAPNSQPGV